jgi:undecaprenyl diphosphate synthase
MSARAAPESPLAGTARYVAIIIDGNGRWARSRRLSMRDGHDAGADNLKARLRDAVELGIEQLTVFSFSTENWLRPIEEVRDLISVLVRRITMETPELHRHSVRMRFIGRRDGVAPELSKAMASAEALTAANRLITLFIAINYGGRAEIVDAASDFRSGTEADFRGCLYAPDMHDPDLIIRTGGERRLSNFLLWQSAYSELVFSDELWPDFTRVDLERALQEFRLRQRRFGGR